MGQSEFNGLSTAWMKLPPRALGTILAVVCVFAVASQLHGQETVFTYQGRLQSGANLANGSFDLIFSVWTNPSGSSQVSGPITNLSTAVVNGLFNVMLDFGSGVFDGNPRWLEIGVRTNGGSVFTVLSPRQPLTATPYAIYAGGVSATGISGTIAAGNIDSGTISSNMLAPGAAAANLAASGQSAVLSGAMVLSGNANATNLTAAGYVNVGGQVDLSWQQRSSVLVPTPRSSHTAIWTGSKMVVWGGVDSSANPLNTGSSFRPGGQQLVADDNQQCTDPTLGTHICMDGKQDADLGRRQFQRLLWRRGTL